MTNNTITHDRVREILAEIRDPESGRRITEIDMVKSIELDASDLTVEIGLTSLCNPMREQYSQEITDLLRAKAPGLQQISVQLYEHERKPQALGQVGLTAKSVIAVGSGKGGVGKSSLSAMLALGLHRHGCKVGLLDSDVYGPSIPHLLGITEKPHQVDNKIVPIDHHGMKVLSIGLMVPADQAVIWRGPMLHSTLTTFIRDTAWGELDYLIIDMPPGTGDIALSLSQMLPITGTIVVCTPQDVALIDAVKAVGMYHKVKIPILGVVENMSGFVCPDNGIRYDIFGKGGAEKYAEQNNLAFLGEVPIMMPVRELGDQGKLVQSYDDPTIASVFENVINNLVLNQAEKARKEVPMPQLPVL